MRNKELNHDKTSNMLFECKSCEKYSRYWLHEIKEAEDENYQKALLEYSFILNNKAHSICPYCYKPKAFSYVGKKYFFVGNVSGCRKLTDRESKEHEDRLNILRSDDTYIE